MEKYFTGITLELFNEYVELCNSKESKVDYNEFISQLGIEVKDLGSVKFITHNHYEGMYQIEFIDKKQYRTATHRSINSIINSLFKEDIMIYGAFAEQFKQKMIEQHCDYDVYKSKTLMDRLRAIEAFYKMLGYEAIVSRERQVNFKVPKVRSIECSNIKVENPNKEESGAYMYELFNMRLEFIKEVYTHYNLYCEVIKMSSAVGANIIAKTAGLFLPDYFNESSDNLKKELERFNSYFKELKALHEKSGKILDQEELKNQTYDKFNNDFILAKSLVCICDERFKLKETAEDLMTVEESETPVDKLIKDITNTFDGVVETIKAKNSDYTKDNYNPFHNFEKSINFGINPVDGMLVRIQDKMSRLHALESGHDAKVDEKSEDTIVDAIGYFALMSGLVKKQQKPTMDESLSLISEIILELGLYKEFRKNG